MSCVFLNLFMNIESVLLKINKHDSEIFSDYFSKSINLFSLF